jgi:OFA family oxalate/formate antiporter-like MFS transporter
MLLPWAFPAAFGPLLFAYLRESTGGYTQALYLIAGMMTIALILPLIISPPRGHKVAAESSVEAAASGSVA